jgi:hypothetical protein
VTKHDTRLDAPAGARAEAGGEAATHKRIAILFDIDGTLIITGGAGATSWRLAFDELYGIPADIGQFTDAGMTDPDVGRRTFAAVLDREPSRAEFARLLERRLYYLHQTVADSDHYRVLDGAEELLTKLIDEGRLLGLVTGNLEAAAHVKLHRANLNRFFSFGGYGSDCTDRGALTRIARTSNTETTNHAYDRDASGAGPCPYRDGGATLIVLSSSTPPFSRRSERWLGRRAGVIAMRDG